VRNLSKQHKISALLRDGSEENAMRKSEYIHRVAKGS